MKTLILSALMLFSTQAFALSAMIEETIFECQTTDGQTILLKRLDWDDYRLTTGKDSQTQIRAKAVYNDITHLGAGVSRDSVSIIPEDKDGGVYVIEVDTDAHNRVIKASQFVLTAQTAKAQTPTAQAPKERAVCQPDTVKTSFGLLFPKAGI